MLLKRSFCLILFTLISEMSMVNGENCSLSGKRKRHNPVKIQVQSARRQGHRQGPTDPPPTNYFNHDHVADMNNRFSTRKTTPRQRITRTTVLRITFEDHCDYLAYYCMKAYDTGIVCARSLYYIYENFKNYCLVDYVNCLESYQVWLVVHMGECFEPGILSMYKAYPYLEDEFLDQMYVAD